MLGKESHKTLLDSAMANLTNPEEIGQFLLQAGEDSAEIYDALAKKTADIEKLQSDNKALAKLNASLYLKVGIEKQEENFEEKTNVKIPTIAELFDEKGMLK